MFGTNGRFYTIGCDKLPGGRGHGEPMRLIVGLGNDDDVVDLLIHVAGRKLLVAASDGRGFIVPEDDVVAQTKGGKRVLNVSGDIEARVCSVVPVGADYIASVGENHKLVVFPINEISEMIRGRGMRLQAFKGGGLSDAKAFILSEGLNWRSGERTRTERDLVGYIGKRAQAGRLAPKGFPRSNKFT
jgi:topoisomerase-4 subunit A